MHLWAAMAKAEGHAPNKRWLAIRTPDDRTYNSTRVFPVYGAEHVVGLCHSCGAHFDRAPGRAKKAYEKQKFCDKICKGKFETRDVGARCCKICGGDFIRHKGEAVTKFAVRQTCGSACFAQNLRKRNPDNGNTIRQ